MRSRADGSTPKKTPCGRPWLWEERERQRAEFLLSLDDARASLARGEGRVITQESMREMAEEVKQRGRARLLGAVEKGIAAAERGDLIEEEETDARIERMFR